MQFTWYELYFIRWIFEALSIVIPPHAISYLTIHFDCSSTFTDYFPMCHNEDCNRKIMEKEKENLHIFNSLGEGFIEYKIYIIIINNKQKHKKTQQPSEREDHAVILWGVVMIWPWSPLSLTVNSSFPSLLLLLSLHPCIIPDRGRKN